MSKARATVCGILWLGAVGASGCAGDGDPRTVEGALTRAAQSVAQKDTASLFRVVDQRARHALSAIVQARREAARIIRASYPQEAQQQALRELGDGAEAKDAADLFRLRCGAPCLALWAQKLGAPAEVRADGPTTVVRTARGSELRLYRGNDSWYGFEWNTDALSRERARAAAELEQVEKNAELYAKQKALQ